MIQKVVHRRPVPYQPHAHVPKYLLCYIVETLECGHQRYAYPPADPLIAKYRKCHKCSSEEPKPK